ncbi:MAG: SpoIIE family protein phosphatase [SAR324 cluster bacterium]|nr:SpoIIE family protein phosphatase [SAR324 cluster bacterium]
MVNKEMSVLVVDDTELNVLLLDNILTVVGYRVLTASNGPEARAIALKEQPGIILLDIMMPGEDGFETCRKLKQNAATADIPVVFISALIDSQNIVKGLSVGGIDYITKPFQVEEVQARVRNYLKLRYTYLRVIEEQAKRLRQIQDAQQAILVKSGDLPEANFGIYYQPILEAGGDFYDVFQVSSGVIGYFVADISGHDLGASFATSALKALLRQNASPLYSPEETLRMVNSVLLSLFTDGQHLTAAYISLDRPNSKLTLVNAAHPPILFLPKQGEPRWLEADGDVLGAFDTALFNCQSIEISEGERFYIYSDGLLETFEGTTRTREQGMAELLQYAVNTRDLEIQNATAEIVKLMFGGRRCMEDDVVLLGVDV